MSYIDALEQGTNKTYTENNAVTNKSTLNEVLDFFALAGAMRDNTKKAVKLFNKAYSVDPQLALRCLFYLRDIRGGQGERDVFRACLQELEDNDPETLKKLLRHIPEYGRWDDLFVLRTPDLLNKVSILIKNQLELDEANVGLGKPISLLAKWLPSENSSSKKSKANALALAKLLNLKPSQYRKKIVALRKYIILLEQRMSKKEWKLIDYGKLPSQAHRKHIKAFYRNDGERYSNYLQRVETNDEKINVNTVYTYELYDMAVDNYTKAVELMWKNLPDYTNGNNALVVADVSGSMYGRPLSVSVSLAIYFAERNKGQFHNYFLTFSENPQLQKIVGLNLLDKIFNLERSSWDMNTDLSKVFELLLNTAVNSKTPQNEMPSTIYIISDMEFDEATTNNNQTNFNYAQKLYKENGYELPHLVFWNVNARNTQVPATKFDDKVTLISGLSQSTFRYAVEGKNPLELMLEILNGDRYSTIEL